MIINPALYKKSTDLPPSVPQAVPEISVSPSGKITATATQAAGMVTGGTVTAEKQLPTRSGGTVTPSKAAQTVAEAGELLTGDLVVEEIPDAYIVPTGSKEITENGLHDVREVETVIVDVESTGADTSDATATASEVFHGKTFYGASGKDTGSFTIDSEIAEQDALIDEIAALADSLGSSGGDGGDIDAFLDGTISGEITYTGETLRDYAFYKCSKITKVSLPNVTSIPTEVCNSCTALVEFSAPKATKSVNNYHFRSCQKLISVDLPLLENLGGAVFGGCNVLEKLTLPSVKKISSGAFSNCSGVVSIDLSKKLAFSAYFISSCPKLVAFIMRSTTPCTLSGTPFTYNSTPASGLTLYYYVPRALLSDSDATKDYRRLTNWSTMASQFRALEDYTVDGTITGELDPSKI